jgi:hypothetical protein
MHSGSRSQRGAADSPFNWNTGARSIMWNVHRQRAARRLSGLPTRERKQTSKAELLRRDLESMQA